MSNTVSSRRLLGATILAVLVLTVSLGAQQTERAKHLGQRMMCVCSCNQSLTACNHVGCTYSHAMLKELDDRIARGDSDDVILQSFLQEYGPTVLVDPPKTGFTGLVWLVPIVAALLAVSLVWSLLRRWRQRADLAPAGADLSRELLERARREAGSQADE
jgi:cytochrome c-type biogenesis protein CcmH/NrfF